MEKKTQTYSLVVEFHRDEEGYMAYFPALPGCHTWAETYEDVIEKAEEALIGYLEALANSGKKIPVEEHRARVSLGLMVAVPVNV